MIAEMDMKRKVKSYHFMTLYNYIICTRLLLFVLYTLNKTECKIEASLICLHIYTDLISICFRLLLFVLYILNRIECKIEASLICLHIY